MKSIADILKNPTEEYTNFQDWEKDFRQSYLEHNPKITEGDLLFDKHFNTTVNKTYGNFIRAKNGESIVPLDTMSHNEINCWAWRDNLDKSLAIKNTGKTPEQIMLDSMQETTVKLQQEKLQQNQEASNKVSALRAIFNACNPLPSNRFKK